MNMKHISSLVVTVSLIISMVLLLSNRQKTHTDGGGGEGWHSSIMQIARMLALSSLEQRANVLEYSHQETFKLIRIQLVSFPLSVVRLLMSDKCDEFEC